MNILENKKFSAIIVAAGESSRMGREKSKILEEINGKTVINYTLKAFVQSEMISDIVIVCRDIDRDEIKKSVEDVLDIRANGKSKKIEFASGGSTRQESVLNGVNAASESDFLVIHDAARPMITSELIDKLCLSMNKHKAVSAAVFAKDTHKLVDDNGYVSETVPRDRLMAVQTPQIFDRELYLKAVDKAEKSQKDFTDDCQLIEFFGEKVFLQESDYKNIKITTPEDLLIAKTFLHPR